MPELLTKCYHCGASLVIPDGAETCRCRHCREVNARPKSTGPALDSLKRANQLRMDCDFANAEASYRRVLDEHPDEHEALWGLVQCRYGVEYVRDARGEAVPVCHDVRRKPMRLDRDFQRACELAPADVRQQYEADAKYIDQAQARIMELQRDGEGYDIFLCYKETDPVTGGRTRESMDVQQLYNILSREGYKVFYAPESLRAMVGEDYEAAIYRAIETATVMLVTATAPEHLTSTWVKSEWSRFLERVDEGEQKFLFPLYRGMRPEHLPLDFTLRHLHGLDMDQMMFLEDLKSALKRCIAKARQPREISTRWDGEPQDPPRPQARPAAEEPAPMPMPPVVPEPVPQPPVRHITVEPASLKPDEPARAQRYSNENDFTVKSTTVMRGGIRTFGYAVIGYRGTDAEVRIPPVIRRMPVLSVGDASWSGFAAAARGSEFSKNPNIRSVVIPEGVTGIASDAFAKCEGLSSVKLPGSVTFINMSAFKYCTGLTELVIPDGVKVISSHLCFNCSGLKAVRIPDSATAIQASAFEGCASLQSVVIPGSVTQIGEWAFDRCDSLRSVTVPASVQKIGLNAFPRSAVLYVRRGSYAEQWARACKHPCEVY